METVSVEIIARPRSRNEVVPSGKVTAVSDRGEGRELKRVRRREGWGRKTEEEEEEACITVTSAIRTATEMHAKFNGSTRGCRFPRLRKTSRAKWKFQQSAKKIFYCSDYVLEGGWKGLDSQNFSDSFSAVKVPPWLIPFSPGAPRGGPPAADSGRRTFRRRRRRRSYPEG